MMLKEEKSKKKRNNNTIDGLVLHSKRSIFQSTLLDNGIAIINVFLSGHQFPSLIVDAVLLRYILLYTRLTKNRQNYNSLRCITYNEKFHDMIHIAICLIIDDTICIHVG